MKRYILIFAIFLGIAGAMAQKTVSNLTERVTGDNIKWYNDPTAGSQYAGTEYLVDGTHYYASQTVNGRESTLRLDVEAHTTAPPTGSAFQPLANGSTVANLSASGTNILWYSTASSSTAYNSTDLLASGNYYASQTLNSCESPGRLAVAVTVNIPGLNVVTQSCPSCSALPGSWVTTPVNTVSSPEMTSGSLYTAMKFSGYINLPTTGVWQFGVHSDDGFRLTLNGSNILENNALDPGTTLYQSASVSRNAGKYPIVIEYFNAQGGTTFNLQYKLDGGAFTTVPASWYATNP
jgi:hypothetical protein